LAGRNLNRPHEKLTEVYADFERIFGRKYGDPFFEEYMTEDADVVLLGMGALSTPTRVTIRKLREQRRSGSCACAGSVPSPAKSWPKPSGASKAVGVIDRGFSFGPPHLSGVVATEVRFALYPGDGAKPPVLGFHLQSGWTRSHAAGTFGGTPDTG